MGDKRKPQLIIIAGGNGAGKSTFFRNYLKPSGIPFVNADEIAREIWPEDAEGNSYAAMQLAESTREDALQLGRSFCFETVFSHESKLEFIERAKQRGYDITIYVIHVCHSAINIGRVEQRVAEGGHAVPTDKIISRIPRTLMHLKAAVQCADQMVLLDNSRYDDPYRVCATFTSCKWEITIKDVPLWVTELINM